MAAEEMKQSDPVLIAQEYDNGSKYKQGLGERGIYDQSRMNERFYVGDQWNGANSGNTRPLIRHNVIKRIGDYKMAVIGSSPITINFSAEGIPNTVDTFDRIKPVRDALSEGTYMPPDSEEVPTEKEINTVMACLSDYFSVTAERLHFDDIRENALRKSYISGTGVVYTYWDENVKTGLYADEGRNTPIKGDIKCEVLDIENVYFGNPAVNDIQEQPYILIAQRKSLDEIKRAMKRNGKSAAADEISNNTDMEFDAGDRAENTLDGSQSAILITKLWKEWNDTATDYTIKAVQVCQNAVVRDEWELGIRMYPLVKFNWQSRNSCAYGDSEVTFLIPNQIAINRLITASAWAVMVMGMPIMVVNNDIVQVPVTNDPGQIIPVTGEADAVNAIRYVNPPNFSPGFERNADSLIANTLRQAGANDAALGDMRPDNVSAIIAVREAATMPMQSLQNRFYRFCEDIARIWAEFWIMKYGKRSLKIVDETGTWYMPFDGERYKELLISTKVEAGASTLWSESQSIRTLDNLFDRQVIDTVQYLTRLPRGTVPNVEGLIREMRIANAAAAAAQDADMQQGAPVPPVQSDLEQMQNEIPIDGELSEVPTDIPGRSQSAIMRSLLNNAATIPETMRAPGIY